MINVNQTDLLKLVPFGTDETYITLDNCLKYNDSVLNENLFLKIIILGLLILIFLYFLNGSDFIKSMISKIKKGVKP